MHDRELIFCSRIATKEGRALSQRSIRPKYPLDTCYTQRLADSRSWHDIVQQFRLIYPRVFKTQIRL
jgi:hypothetical protein